MNDNYFATLNNINVNTHTEKKNGLTYLSWAWAWGEVKKLFPEANYTIYENADGWNYFTDGRTCWVKTGVTVNGIEHIEYLPVMDYKNRSIPADCVTSFDVNKAIQRSLTKACARHGLGLYIYAGEDLPEATSDAVAEQAAANGDPVPYTPSAKAKYVEEANMNLAQSPLVYKPHPKKEKAVVNMCEECKKIIEPKTCDDGTIMQPKALIELSMHRVNRVLCPDCLKAELAKKKEAEK